MSNPKKKGGAKLYSVKLTLDEINALLGTSGNADAQAMAEDEATEEEGQAFLDALESATAKLHGAK